MSIKKIVKLFVIIIMIIFSDSLSLAAQRIHKVPIQRYGSSSINRRILWGRTSGEIIWDELNNRILIKHNKGRKNVILNNITFSTYNLETERNKEGNALRVLCYNKGNAICDEYGMVNIELKHIYPVNKKGVTSSIAGMIEIVIIFDDQKVGYSGKEFSLISDFKF